MPPTTRLLLLRFLGMFAAVVLLTWPMATSPGTMLTGFPSIDAQDTQMLRGLVADVLTHPWTWPDTDRIYFPEGFPALLLTPNLLDHLTAAPFVFLLPFPWADNAWWVVVLLLNGLCAHRLGRRLGGSEAAGWLAALAVLTSEPILREANLHHAPQAMVFWGPLYLDALLGMRREASQRRAAMAALWLALAAMSYWYYGLFLVVGTAPLLVRLRPKELGIGAAVILATCAPFIAPQLMEWDTRPLTKGGMIPAPAMAHESYDALPDSAVFSAQHGSDLLWWVRRGPLDLSNRVSIVLVVAAIWGAIRSRRDTDSDKALGAWNRRSLWFMAGIGGVMIMGPWLRHGDGLWLGVGDPVKLPFQWMRELHPFLARLTWPERWGLLVPLALAALAARAPKPALFAGLIVIENLVLSGNAPLQTTSVRHKTCWKHLDTAPGALVVLPFRRGGLRASEVGVQQRFHRRPVVNPVLLPPGALAPPLWHHWRETEPLMIYLTELENGRSPGDPGGDAVRSFQAQGISAIAVDVEPGGVLTAGGINRYRAGLGRHLGPPIDLGCALVWWLDTTSPPPTGLEDGDIWRKEAAEWKEAHPAPELDTLIQPTWDAVQRKGGRR